MDKISFPVITNGYSNHKLNSYDLVKIQPLSMPTGVLLYCDYEIKTLKTPKSELIKKFEKWYDENE